MISPHVEVVKFQLAPIPRHMKSNLVALAQCTLDGVTVEPMVILRKKNGKLVARPGGLMVIAGVVVDGYSMMGGLRLDDPSVTQEARDKVGEVLLAYGKAKGLR